MAGVELATAYVNIVPSTSKLGDEMKKYFGETEQQAEETGKKSGNRFTKAFGKWAKRGALVAGLRLVAAIGAAVIGGLKSAVDQQQGQAVLGGLYGDAEKAASTLESLKKVSSKSPFGLFSRIRRRRSLSRMPGMRARMLSAFLRTSVRRSRLLAAIRRSWVRRLAAL